MPIFLLEALESSQNFNLESSQKVQAIGMPPQNVLFPFSQTSLKTLNDTQLLLYLCFILKGALHNFLLEMSITPKAQGEQWDNAQYLWNLW